MKVFLSWGDYVPPSSSEPYWSCTVTLYGDLSEAKEDQTVLGCKWEACEDIAYAVLTAAGETEQALEAAADELTRSLEQEGYDYEEI